MPKFDPGFAVKALNDVSPGALVIFNHGVAFAGINPSASVKLITLAAYDASSTHFVYRYFDAGQPNVLIPGGGEIVIRPKLDSFTPNVSLQASANLFYSDAPYVIVKISNAGELRLLNLQNGSFVGIAHAAMDAFTSWEAGVMSSGQFISLFKV